MSGSIKPSPDELSEGEMYQLSKDDPVTEAPADYAAVLTRLAALSPIEYDRCRAVEADNLSIRAPTLDAEVKRVRGEADPDNGDSAIIFPDPEPWPDPIEGADLLDALTTAIIRHLILPSGAAEAMALWIVHAHAHNTASISPILAVTSPTPECGKTTLLTLLGAVVPHPLPASNITAAALFRAVEKWCPTVLVDEADTFLKDNDELRGVLNSGHNRNSAYVIRTTGENHDPCRFHTWSPKAIALIGKLPPTLESRAIHIALRRIAEGETVEPLRGDRLDHLKPLLRMAWRWTSDNAARLAGAEPNMPSTLRGRAADNWRHLLAIADLAGGDWPQRARQAAEKLSTGHSERSAGIMLLSDLRALFRERDIDRLSSAEIVGALETMEDRPWPEWKTGKPITVRQLATLLEPFSVTPNTIRIASGTSKGYLLKQFEEPFRRYLPDRSVTPSQPAEAQTFEQLQSVTRGENVTDENTRKHRDINACDGVTDENPEYWESAV